MKYEYTHLIPENVAPKGATRIVVKGGDKEVCAIPASRFGGLTPPTGEPLYSFGIISDPHITPSSQPKSNRLEAALRFFSKTDGCAFVCDCGDSTNVGFTVGDTVDVSQFAEYKRICDLFPSMPVYNIAGNHDHYNAQLTGNYSPALPTETTLPDGTVYPAGTPLLTLYEHYTGHGITYEVIYEFTNEFTNGEDVFLFVGQSTSGTPMSYADRDWLLEKLKEHKERRCLIFVHSFVDDGSPDGIEDSGNPCFARNNSIFGSWNTGTVQNFMTALKNHGRAVLFHGHSHMMFEAQELDEKANYTKINGYHSVHVPSVGNPRWVLSADGSWSDDPAKAPVSPQAYLLDVYEDCIVLNGLSFSGTNATPVPLGTYRINT